ncbi:MAG: glutamine-hydrolyzing carbamoyl-phosphate synthase small subunit [Thermoproteota archaeon]|nr:glutamine-hydrolyzing carbamoyl-phosphate synthase small subunit [Thermoproteota archaeon]
MILDDGSNFTGIGFGYPKSVMGEIVFNTGMVGYTETLTDPSYRGQILCFTYPSIGNYGVPSEKDLDEFGLPKYFESNQIQAAGLIVHDLSNVSSHWSCVKTLDEWLYQQKIPGIYGVDTRQLTKKIRINGVMNGKLVINNNDNKDNGDNNNDGTANLLANDNPDSKSSFNYDSCNFMPEVSVQNPVFYGKKSDPLIALIDTGTKNSIIRNLVKSGFSVIRLPWNAPAEQILSYNPRGVVISNGPGDPVICKETILAASKIIDSSIPTLGICLGHQILAIAGGAKTTKLKFGHRGQNKTCVDLVSNHSFITSQNHGYGVELNSLKNTDFDLWFQNIDDKTVEGIKHKLKPVMGVQFHPEASPGPFDCLFVFDIFKNLVTNKKDDAVMKK